MIPRILFNLPLKEKIILACKNDCQMNKSRFRRAFWWSKLGTFRVYFKDFFNVFIKQKIFLFKYEVYFHNSVLYILITTWSLKGAFMVNQYVSSINCCKKDPVLKRTSFNSTLDKGWHL